MSRKIGPFDGTASVAEMLGAMDPASRDRLLADIGRREPETARKIRGKLVPSFAEILRCPDEAIRPIAAAWLRAVPLPKLALALRNIPVDDHQGLLRNLPARAAEALREEITSQGPRRLSDVQSAQRELTLLAAPLLPSGPVTR